MLEDLKAVGDFLNTYGITGIIAAGLIYYGPRIIKAHLDFIHSLVDHQKMMGDTQSKIANSQESLTSAMKSNAAADELRAQSISDLHLLHTDEHSPVSTLPISRACLHGVDMISLFCEQTGNDELLTKVRPQLELVRHGLATHLQKNAAYVDGSLLHPDSTGSGGA